MVFMGQHTTSLISTWERLVGYFDSKLKPRRKGENVTLYTYTNKHTHTHFNTRARLLIISRVETNAARISLFDCLE